MSRYFVCSPYTGIFSLSSFAQGVFKSNAKEYEFRVVENQIYEYEEILSEYGFIRCHQSHLIDKKFVKSWVKEDGDHLLLFNGKEIPISRTKKDYVKKALDI